MAMDSELLSLIQSNNALDDDQTRDVRRMLHVACTGLSLTEQTILMVSLVLADLEHQKRRQHEDILAMEGALSPIRRIPPEILVEVFIFCGGP
ncbi:hypothetical protein B0H17DRAFT_591288 [Mycena rosella]|uniref:Uncharacterized protein n=1 Tax=Mycena rosella TaxID=1033263 RepID=A0AAD7DHF7_MYCRO|nr:hypothetical protein B0H17DRAFT_591288 [Mycena rosella]